MVTKKEKSQASDRSDSGARAKPHTGGGEAHSAAAEAVNFVNEISTS